MKIIKATVGILRNPQGQILVSKRRCEQFMGGFWELPGGKIEDFESAESAVIRELSEEIGIKVQDLELFIEHEQKYPDRLVKLSIFNITKYKNKPKGLEGQKIAWFQYKNFIDFKLLPNMRSFIVKADLPKKLWITPSLSHYENNWLTKFDEKLRQNFKIIQLRSKTDLDHDFIQKLHQKCQQNHTKLILNIPNQTFAEPYCDGHHLTSNQLMRAKIRPASKAKLLSASTHNLAEAKSAQNLKVDFAFISPIKFTKTHPKTTPIGWQQGKKIANAVNIPMYFLGGMSNANLPQALKSGAHGIASVSKF